MRKNNQEDNLLKQVLTQKADEMEIKDSLLSQIKVNIYEREGEISMNNKRFSFKNKKRALVMMMGCIALISTTVIAGVFGKGAWTSHTYNKYDKFPKEERVSKDIGFSPKYVESLPHGFEFLKGGIGKSKLTDDVKNVLAKTKFLSLGYIQASTGKRLNFNAEKVEEEYIMRGPNENMQETYKGCSLYYYEQTYKFVPVDYELTEEDQRAYDAGELEISVGADEVSVEQIQSISWYEEGVRYSIGGNDLNLPVEELLDMAKTIIDAK